MSNKKSNNRGYTLAEVIVAISIFSVAITVVSSYIIMGYKTNRFAEEQNDAIEHARNGIETMVKEIREAGTGKNGDYPIVQALDQSFSFYSDIDLDEETEKVRYYLDDTNLKKSITEPSGFPAEYLTENETVNILSRYVRNDTLPIFYYYNKDWPNDTVNNPLSTPASPNDVKIIRLNLEININPAIAPEPFILQSYTQVRNLKENL
ncbi:prepilin-type N-terminal cleavage/methylation domain-containing protein [Candidatus Parcubacteria bacterium]|nr:MAG: prepilin-type N-terminal cleavage/methylation domain-containing protein [Candidatus Parcubacteria bacterium]